MQYNDDLFREETINVKEIIHKLWRHWEYYAVCIMLAMLIAFYFNKFKEPIFETYTTVLINEQKSAFDPQALLDLEYASGRSNIQNEIEILKSQTVLEEVFAKMDCEVRYFRKQKFFSSEIYKESPFNILIDSTLPNAYNFQVNIEIYSPDSILLTLNQGNAKIYLQNEHGRYSTVVIPDLMKIIKSGEPFSSEYFNFTLTLNNQFNADKYNNVEYYFVIPDTRSNLKEFSNIEISILDKSSVIKVALTHHNLRKSVDFLNTLTKVYLEKELNRKNLVAEKSLEFIQMHLKEINDSLSVSEQNLLIYQTDKSALNIDFQTQKIFEQLEKLQNDKANFLIQQKYYQYLEQTLEKSTSLTEIVAPSVMNVENPFLNKQIANLIEIQSKLNNIKLDNEVENPYKNSLITEIDNAKKVLIEFVQNDNKSLNMSIADINNRIDKLAERIDLLPKTQRELFNYERNFKVYDNIYTFLLQKRSETMLAKASNVPLNEIVDIARLSNYRNASKNPRLSYMIALLIALIIPSIFIYIKDLLNNKIQTDSDVEKETDIPILGRIINSKNSEMAFAEPKSVVSESFRMLRTNLDFARKGKGSQVILISSTMQGEGKSYISNNLAHSLALNSKKTILVVFDLRKPKIYINPKSSGAGLSNYLINKCKLEAIIEHSDIDNLDIIQTGVLPPNPSELISSNATHNLFEALRDGYDYIIVDSPPIGIISDGLSLSHFADITLFVARYNYTKIKPFGNILKHIKGKVKNINLVLNALETGKKAYGYNYGYGYGKYEGYEY